MERIQVCKTSQKTAIPAQHQKKASDTSQAISLDLIQSKLLNLQQKYSSFVSFWLSASEKAMTQENYNRTILDQNTENKIKSRNSEQKTLNQVIEDFANISSLIPQEHEEKFNNFKAETLNYIFGLHNKVHKSFQASPKHPTSKSQRTGKGLTLRDSNLETKETFLKPFSEDFSQSRDSKKHLNKSHLFKKKNLRRLKLDRIDELSPIEIPDNRKCLSSGRLKKIQNFEESQDSIVLGKGTDSRLIETLKYSRKFMKTIRNLCENYPGNEEKNDFIIRKCEDFDKVLENIKSQETSNEETKLKEELENCKKVALMYEQRLKIKMETILILRKKEKEWLEKGEKCKKMMVFFYEDFVKLEKLFFDRIICRVNEKCSQFNLVEEKIKKNLAAGLEEIKKAVEITSKNNVFHKEIDMLHNHIEDLEHSNKELVNKLKNIEIENSGYKNKCFELENKLKVLNLCKENSLHTINELDDLALEVEKLKKFLKIKEFELKQKEFEKAELDSDKNDLLSRIEVLEIEKIESHECINSLTIKYNHEIESFIFNNTIQRNQIQSLEKEKEQILKEKHDLEGKLTEINTLKAALKNRDEVITQNEALTKQIRNLSKVKNEVEKELEKQAKKLENIEKELKKSLEINGSLEGKIEETLGRNQTLEEKLMKIKQLNQTPPEKEVPKISVEFHQDQISSLNSKITLLEQSQELLKTEQKKLKEKLASSQSKKKALKLQLEKKNNSSETQEKLEKQTKKIEISQETKKNQNEELSFFKEKLSKSKSKINSLKKSNSETTQTLSKITGEAKALLKLYQDAIESQEKLESINKYLIQDIKHRSEAYKESIQDIKLDKYQLEKTLKSHESKIDSLNQSCISLESALSQISPIPETLNSALAESLKQNQIDFSIKSSYLNKIAQLEEDVKNLTSKLLKKNNENSILEDCLMVYSPRSHSSQSGQEEIAKIKCELIETHKKLEESLNEKSSLLVSLSSHTSQLEDSRKIIEKNKESLAVLESAFKGKNEEFEKLKKKFEEVFSENEKLNKLLNEARINLKNSEVTYNKNISYLEDQVKKYRKNESDERSSVLFQRSFVKDCRVSRESSLVISAIENSDWQSPRFKRNVLVEDFFEEGSFD